MLEIKVANKTNSPKLQLTTSSSYLLIQENPNKTAIRGQK